ncbi:MAG: HAMP domain-containing protein [Chloroflexi bacterium]|nr:HAMP domain-containing protein [Chloroflexota bacterium]MCI0828527.1 HAMP domain-containing protein [Chloroflexota bacterium]MCI0846970.1 HAMP domain-containing protein [Chloroflexota bacterium]MCI0862776.1 HAMP domain-containing protein [Chloroflexota bacterium]MCI0896718.1 HAMP domain-containing protein [Chloroflexota bacterium]
MDRIDRIWQPTYGNVTVVSGAAPAGVLVNELALQITSRFPDLDRALENTDAAGTSGDREVDASVLFALTDVRRALVRVRLQVLEIAQNPKQTAPELAEDAGKLDEVLRVLLNGGLKQELLGPVDVLAAQWEESSQDIKALIPLAEEFAGGLEAAREIAGSSEPLLREIAVVVGLFDQESRDKINQVQWFLVAVTGVFLYICALAMWVTWRTIRPLDRLTRATTIIAEGDLSARVEVGSRDEIGMLAAAFNRMTEDLQRRDIELAAVNEELEAFNYSVSHDLRAPLRTIDGFSQALLEDYEDKLDDEGKDYLGRTRAASQRMGRLIDDLLNLSRVTRREMRFKEVDLSAIARQVVVELEEGESGRDVTFEITEGAVTMGDPNLLRTVLDNLIGNAWKFTGNHPTAKIEFGITEDDGRPAYFVRDDGAGFDMEYADNLFGAFQRLHGMTEFPGTGIGLATVQRIIHRHGGRVWAEGKVEQGATFYFTLG